MNRRESREQAFLFVFESNFSDYSIEDIIENAQMSRDIEISDFAKNIFNGVNNNKEKIDMLIEENSRSWKKDRLSKVSVSLLRMAIYEMMFEEEIPDSVSINEAVELAKKYSTKEDASFINGVLGSISKKVATANE